MPTEYLDIQGRVSPCNKASRKQTPPHYVYMEKHRYAGYTRIAKHAANRTSKLSVGSFHKSLYVSLVEYSIVYNQTQT